MKKITLVTVFAALTFSASVTSAFNKKANVQTEIAVQNKEPIKFKDLPTAVKDAFRADGHQETEVLKIFKIKIEQNLYEFKILVEEENQKTEISYKAKTNA